MTSEFLAHLHLRTIAVSALALSLAACALPRPPAQIEAPTPAQWHAALPHEGSVAQLQNWWERTDDPLLAMLIRDAQTLSPTMATARSQFEQARAAQVAAGSALLPAVDAQGSASRGFNQQAGGIANTAQLGVQAGWELDLFGLNRAGHEAATERLEGARAQWHAARVSVAAEVAQQYSNWRYCQRQWGVLRDDVKSREQTARLSSDSERAGFTSPANAALAAASYSDGKVRLAQQRLQCDIGLKTLVALTGHEEPTLRTELGAAPAVSLSEALFSVDHIPARVVAQRPDVYAAEREVAAASADVGSAEAERYPRLSISGSIGRLYMGAQGMSGSSNIWSVGPLALSLPIFDAGRRKAQVTAAQARYDAAAVNYRAQVRQAASEVEQALTQLASTRERSADALSAAAGYRRSFEATQALWNGGLASQLDLENARRTALASEQALVTLEHERMTAWIQLYRAAGGGWDAHASDSPDHPEAPVPPAPPAH